MQRGDILISGAGIAGPTLAYWLLHYGFRPTLVERAPVLRTGGYMIDFWGVGYDVAERMGVLSGLKDDAYQLTEVRLVNDAGHRVAGFDARLFGAATGGRYFSLLRSDLARRLYQSVEDRVETLFGDQIVGLEEDGDAVNVAFEHASPRRFDLVVGAGGLHSRVRRLAWEGNGGAEHYLGYYVAAFTAQGYPHRDHGAYVSFSQPGVQVARYALKGGRTAFLLIFGSNEALALPAHEIALQKAVIRQRFHRQGWECDEILAAMERSNDFYFDPVTQIRLKQWSRGRLVLVGDAGYCPSLLAGEGSSFAMAGAYLLARSLARARGDHAAAFAEYQRRFMPFVEAKQRSAERIGWWFAPRTRIGVWLRNAVTNLMGLPVLGERVMARTLGDRFDLDHALAG